MDCIGPADGSDIGGITNGSQVSALGFTKMVKTQDRVMFQGKNSVEAH